MPSNLEHRFVTIFVVASNWTNAWQAFLENAWDVEPVIANS